eukprot:2325911-Rhodomonas_salina.2
MQDARGGKSEERATSCSKRGREMLETRRCASSEPGIAKQARRKDRNATIQRNLRRAHRTTSAQERQKSRECRLSQSCTMHCKRVATPPKPSRNRALWPCIAGSRHAGRSHTPPPPPAAFSGPRITPPPASHALPQSHT